MFLMDSGPKKKWANPAHNFKSYAQGGPLFSQNSTNNMDLIDYFPFNIQTAYHGRIGKKVFN